MCCVCFEGLGGDIKFAVIHVHDEMDARGFVRVWFVLVGCLVLELFE